MSLVKWDPSFSVKVAVCDEHHKKLFQLVNELHDAMGSGKGTEIIERVVKELANYTKFHFSAEEALMEKSKYPELSSHRLQHQAFIKKVEVVQHDISSGKGGQSAVVLAFLKEWLTKHIKESDQRYSSHLNANGVS